MSCWTIVPRGDMGAVWLVLPSGVALTKEHLAELIRDLTEAHRSLRATSNKRAVDPRGQRAG